MVQVSGSKTSDLTWTWAKWAAGVKTEFRSPRSNTFWPLPDLARKMSGASFGTRIITQLPCSPASFVSRAHFYNLQKREGYFLRDAQNNKLGTRASERTNAPLQHHQSAFFFTAKPKSVLLSDKIACCRIHFAFVSSFAGIGPFLYFASFLRQHRLPFCLSLAHTHKRAGPTAVLLTAARDQYASIDPAQYESQIFSKLNSDPGSGQTKMPAQLDEGAEAEK